MKMRRLITLLVIVALTMLLCLPAAAEWNKDVVLDACDTCQWAGSSGAKLTTSDKTEGKGSVEWTVSAGSDSFVMHTSFAPVNAEGANTLVLDVYFSDVDTFYSTGACSFEITSSGQYDVEETAWDITAYELYDG